MKVAFFLAPTVSEKEILVEDQCNAVGNYQPKANAETIKQFKSITLMNVKGKIFMGILLRRSVAYMLNIDMLMNLFIKPESLRPPDVLTIVCRFGKQLRISYRIRQSEWSMA